MYGLFGMFLVENFERVEILIEDIDIQFGFLISICGMVVFFFDKEEGIVMLE